MGWVGFDLDGVLAVYDKWRGVEHIGDPIPRMVEMVKDYLAHGKEVRIVTARVCDKQGDRDRIMGRDAVKAWCRKHIGQELEVTAEKDWEMELLYDDRCRQVHTNTGVLFCEHVVPHDPWNTEGRGLPHV